MKIKDKTLAWEGLKIEPFRKNVRHTTAHKHSNYIEVIFLTKGSGFHTIDSIQYPISTPIVFIVRQEQVHFWNIDSEPEGFVLILKKSFVKNWMNPEIKRLITDLSAFTTLKPTDPMIQKLFELLHQERFSGESLQNTIAQGLLMSLLAKLLQSQNQQTNVARSNSPFQEFLDLLEKDGNLKNNVSYYANALHTTPQNLNAICRKATGQSCSEIIGEHIIDESKRMLLYSDVTISEMATVFDFKDNSHFTKYFKNKAGVTPSNFRKGAI